MNKKFKYFFTIGVLLCAGVFVFNPGFVSSAQEDNVEDLKKQIEVLQKRVGELEAGQAKTAQKEEDGPRDFLRRGPGRWDPFTEILRMQEEMDRMFQDSFIWGGPASKGMFRSNMYYDDTFAMKEEKEQYIIEFDMAGMNEGKIDIQVNQQSLTVRGEHRGEQQDEGPNSSFRSKSYATFMKTIPVPPDGDTARMTTENKGDKLIITLPKKIIE
jgi:HSP20 family protein